MSFWTRQTSTSRACALPDTHFMRDEDKNGPNESLCNMRKYNCLWDGETSGYGGGGAGGGSDDDGGTFLFYFLKSVCSIGRTDIEFRFVRMNWLLFYPKREKKKKKKTSFYCQFHAGTASMK